MRRVAILLSLLLGAASAPPAAAAQGAITGVVHAPPGRDVQGTIVSACAVEGDRCSPGSRRSRAVRIDASGASARFTLAGLAAGEYMVIALRDVNGDGAEDPGDWVGEYRSGDAVARVRPPATGLEVRMHAPGAPPAAARPSAPPGRAPATPPPAGPPAAGRVSGIEGIYEGVTRNLVAPGPGSPVASGITWTPGRDWMAFYPGGRVYLALPEEGLAVPLDWEKVCARSPAWCATYEVVGDQVRIRWRTGEQKVLRRDREGVLWTTDRLNYNRLPRLDGMRLDGTYHVTWKEEHKPVRLSFTRGGAFSERGLLDAVSWNSSDYSESAQRIRGIPGGAGTYDIRDNTLELRYRDGRVIRLVVYVAPGEARSERPGTLYVNSFDFVPVR
ncbi:MAG TPA: hypothetical protein VGR37_01415 [Longimicrobiaceae bacterium]|nr:hypothetical protein [Longimicrobiaceae bacterium]